MSAETWETVDPFEPAPPPPTAAERFPRLDLAALVAPDRPPRRWTVRRFLPQGASVSLVAPPGVGKSLLLLALATTIARGWRAFASLAIPRPARVLYVDMENTEDDLADRLESLGITPETAPDLDRLILLHLPDLAPLDTPAGAADLAAALDAYGIGRGDLVILDSFQRVVQGPENDSDTYRAYYRNTGVLLKRRGVTVVRTDNTGKDAERGARGSSSKRDDVDIEYIVTRDADTGHLRLRLGKVRLSDVAALTFALHTDDDGRLTYSIPLDPFGESVRLAVSALEAAQVPPGQGLNSAWRAVKGAPGVTRNAVREAQKERRDMVTGVDETVPPTTAHPSSTPRATQDGTPPARPDDDTLEPLESLGKARAAENRHDDGTVDLPAVPPPPPYIGAARRHTDPPDYCPKCGQTGRHTSSCPIGKEARR